MSHRWHSYRANAWAMKGVAAVEDEKNFEASATATPTVVVPRVYLRNVM